MGRPMKTEISTEKAAAAMRHFKWISVASPRQFNADAPPERPVPRYSLNGVPVCTPGNLTAITAPIKSGKSAAVGAMLAAPIAAEAGLVDRDLLGFSASPPAGKKLIHLDTEQSHFDADANVRRASMRAGVERVPDWCWSYFVAGFPPGNLMEILRALLWLASLEGGTYAVLIDGIGDMVADVNDAEECNAVVSELHALAIEHDCVIVGVIHFNPGSEKSRGHLGSQLERKAESNLALEKDGDGVVTLYGIKQRGAPIAKNDGPRFAWSTEHGMHMSTGTAGEVREDVKRTELRELFSEVFETRSSMKFADMSVGIVKARDCTKRTAFYITSMKNIIQNGDGVCRSFIICSDNS